MYRSKGRSKSYHLFHTGDDVFTWSEVVEKSDVLAGIFLVLEVFQSSSSGKWLGFGIRGWGD